MCLTSRYIYIFIANKIITDLKNHWFPIITTYQSFNIKNKKLNITPFCKKPPG